MKPKFITFTGFDDRTRISDMIALSKKFSIEWGVLVSPTNKDARFPCTQAIKELLTENTFFNLSLHCCGRYSKQAQLMGTFPYYGGFKRIQLNGKIIVPKFKIIKMHNIFNKRFIIQRKEFNPLWQNMERGGIDFLFDTSGGRGITPNEFPDHPGYFCGYAGGITPDNVTDCIKNINALEGAEYWIDMESGVRTNGWFDLEKVNRVCLNVYG